MLASMLGHAELVRLLVEHGAELNGTTKYHLSPLMLAPIRGHTGAVYVLHAAGADTSSRGPGAPGLLARLLSNSRKRPPRRDLFAHWCKHWTILVLNPANCWTSREMLPFLARVSRTKPQHHKLGSSLRPEKPELRTHRSRASSDVRGAWCRQLAAYTFGSCAPMLP